MSSELLMLKAKVDELSRYAHLYTPAEAIKKRDELRGLQNGYYREVSGEAIDNLSRSAYRLQKANNAIREKKKAYLNKFDSEKLAVELSITSALIGVALKSGSDKVEALTRLTSDVKSSGNINRMKALYELLPGAINSRADGLDGSMKINRLQDSLKSYVSEEIPSEDDKKKVYEAHQEFKNEAIEFRKVASLLGESDVDHPLATTPLGKAYQRYQVTANEFGLPDIQEKK